MHTGSQCNLTPSILNRFHHFNLSSSICNLISKRINVTEVNIRDETLRWNRNNYLNNLAPSQTMLNRAIGGSSLRGALAQQQRHATMSIKDVGLRIKSVGSRKKYNLINNNLICYKLFLFTNQRHSFLIFTNLLANKWKIYLTKSEFSIFTL